MSRSTGVQFTGMLAARVSANALQAINVIVLARAVSPDLVGIASAVISLGMVVFTVTDFGASTFVMKRFAEADLGATRSGLRLIAVSGWLAGAIASATAFALHEPLGIPLAVLPLVASVAVDRLVEYRLAVPIAATSTSVPAISILLRRSTQFAGFVAMWQLGVGALAAYALVQLLGALIGYVHSLHFLPRYLDMSAPATMPMRAILVESFPYLVNNVSVHIQLLDTFLVTAIAGPYRGGLYSAAMRVTSPLTLIPGTLAAAVLPAATRSTPYATRRISQRLSLATPLLVIAATAGGLGFAEPVCVLLFGDAYASAAHPLTLLLMTFPFALLAAALSAVLQARGDEVRVARVGLASAGLFVVAVGIGALVGGAVGAATGGLLAVAVKCLPLIFWATRPRHRRRTGRPPHTFVQPIEVGEPPREPPPTALGAAPPMADSRRLRTPRDDHRNRHRRRDTGPLQVDRPAGGRNVRRGVGRPGVRMHHVRR